MAIKQSEPAQKKIVLTAREKRRIKNLQRKLRVMEASHQHRPCGELPEKVVSSYRAVCRTIADIYNPIFMQSKRGDLVIPDAPPDSKTGANPIYDGKSTGRWQIGKEGWNEI